MDLIDPLVAAKALTLIALIFATYRYAHLVRLRNAARRAKRDQEEAGLRGLVRVLGPDMKGGQDPP